MAILQAARRHAPTIVALDDAQIVNSGVLVFLDQLQSSFLRLTSSEDADCALSDEDVEVFLIAHGQR